MTERGRLADNLHALAAVATVVAGCASHEQAVPSNGELPRDAESAYVVRVPSPEPDPDSEIDWEHAAYWFVPEWWNGAASEVRFCGRNFDYGSPGFWGDYQGVWSIRNPRLADGEQTTFLEYRSHGKATRLDERTWRVDREGDAPPTLFARIVGDAAILATSEGLLAAGTQDRDLGLPDAGSHDLWIDARTAELQSFGIQRATVALDWKTTASSERFLVTFEARDGIEAVKRFLETWPYRERLGTLEVIRTASPTVFEARFRMHSVEVMAQGLHFLVGFHMFI